MGKNIGRRARGLLAAACLLASGAAFADEPKSEPVAVPDVPPAVLQSTATALHPELDQREPFKGSAARDAWQERRPWRYGTQQLFPITRGMADAGIPALARWPLYVFTVPLDTGNLFFSSIGALYGN